MKVCLTMILPLSFLCLHDILSAAVTADVDNQCAAIDERPLLQAESNRTIITVRQDGTGHFTNITDAINSIPRSNSRRTIIMIGGGTYVEKVIVDQSKPYVMFYGDPHDPPTISFNGTAAVYGTFDSATVTVESDYFIAYGIIFENSAPRPVHGEPGTQAVAMRISGDKAAFYNCTFFGFQDTLCDQKGMHYFQDCLISGTVDFIFGNGKSIYYNCTINSVSNGYAAITAQGRSTISENSGFSFINCTIIGSGKAYLGRAWRDSSTVVFAYTYMGNLINPKGWNDWGIPKRDGTVYYGEYKCKGPGASTHQRVRYAKELTDEEAKPFLNMNFICAESWLFSPLTL